MSLCINNILQMNNIENFSLIKKGKNRVFGIYKDLRFSKQTNESNFIKKKIYNKTNSNYLLNNLIISKEINLFFISRIKNQSDSDKKKIKLMGEGVPKSPKRKSVFTNNNKIYHKKDKNNLSFDKRNTLIKPRMIENIPYDKDNLINNQKNESFKPININNYKYYNSDIIYNNHNYNYFNYTIKNKNINNQFINNKNKYFSFPNLFQNTIQNDFNNNKNITESIFVKAPNLNNKINNPFFFPDEYITPNFKMPININKNLYCHPNHNNNFLCNQDQLIDTKIKKDKFLLNSENNKLTEVKNNNTFITTTKETLFNIKEDNLKNKNNINKGRKTKNSSMNVESKHTKYSTDNMMRKIKNKVIESSRLLINKLLKEEFKYISNIKCPYREFLKIKGSFSQELNIKYNFWFYQIKLKDIFLLEISNKYTTIQKSSNKELIDYLYSDINKNKFIKTKKLLETSFHQYYHDIFLDENEEWKNYYGIVENNNIFNINYLLKTLEEEDKKEGNINEKKYVNDINSLAHNYESYFLEKKPRNLDNNNKKNEFVKSFLLNSSNDLYLNLAEEVRKIKNFYEKRKTLMNLDKKTNDKPKDNSLIIKKHFNINKSNIDLKEEETIKKGTIIIVKKENDIIDKNDDNDNNKNFEKDLKNEINEKSENNNTFCNKKREGGKIKYFMNIHTIKKLDNINKFLINKLD